MNPQIISTKRAIHVVGLFLALSLSVSDVIAAEPVVISVEELNQNPAKYDGQKILIVAELSGTTFTEETREGRLRLKVKDDKIIVDCAEKHKNGINFILPKSQESLIAGFPDTFTRVKLTVSIKQGARGFWLAVVSGVEREGARAKRCAAVGDKVRPDVEELVAVPLPAPTTFYSNWSKKARVIVFAR